MLCLGIRSEQVLTCDFSSKRGILVQYGLIEIVRCKLYYMLHVITTSIDSAVCLDSIDILRRNTTKQEWSAKEQRIRSGNLVPAGLE